MSHWLHKLYQHRYFLLFIILFGYVQSVYMRITVQQEINAYIFTPEAAVFTLIKAGMLYAIILFFIRKWLKSIVFSTKDLLVVFGSSLITYLIGMKVIGFLIALVFGTVVRNFNQETFVFTLFSDFLDGFIYGSFFLAYYYFKKNSYHQQQLATYHQALADSRIHQLKSQLNPHFLFNNLNILDQLIEEDKHKASEFLNEFAEIYRYVLQASDKKLVSLNEELAFAERYFRLIGQKFGNAYQMQIGGRNSSGYIVPLTLQLLIENAVHHNLGTEENPVIIAIDINETILTTNTVNLKKNIKPSNGQALKNLKEQYRLLTEKPIEIQHSLTTFSVSIPLIKTQVI